MINEFILTKQNLIYTLTCNGHIISDEQFWSDKKAIEYYKQFVSSFVKSILIIKL